MQSSWLVLAYSFGWLSPAPDCAIFADTKGEPAKVYDWLAWLAWLRTQASFPIHEVTRGDLWKSATRVRTTRDGERSYIETAIPVFTVDGLHKGKGQRHCTRDFKIKVVQNKVRELLGLKRISKTSGVLCEMIIGISTDEAHRMKHSREHWIVNKYPLIDELNFSRQDCIDTTKLFFGVEPPRSACTYCPFRSDEQWLALTKVEFADAVVKEKQLQAAYARASEITSVPYFHSSRVPLDQVQFKTGNGRNHIGNECEGFCGV